MLRGRRCHGFAHRWAYWGTHRNARRSDRSAGRWANMPAADGLAERRTHRPVGRLADRPARRRTLCLADVWARSRSRECSLNRPGDSQRSRRRHEHRCGQRHHNLRPSTAHCSPPSTSPDITSDHSRVRQRVRQGIFCSHDLLLFCQHGGEGVPSAQGCVWLRGRSDHPLSARPLCAARAASTASIGSDLPTRRRV
jgi:hypothetical protein